jgi:uncharacterized protein YkwD
MHTARAVMLALVVVSSGCLGVGASNQDTSQDGTDGLTIETVNTTEIERAIHEEVNAERTKRGLDALEWDDNLHQVAQFHSRDMAEQKYIAHDSPSGESVADRYAKFNIECSATANGETLGGGENIAATWPTGSVEMEHATRNFNNNETKIAQGIVHQWLNSKAHKENMLLPNWSSEGIGVTVTEMDGERRVIATQNFC